MDKELVLWTVEPRLPLSEPGEVRGWLLSFKAQGIRDLWLLQEVVNTAFGWV